MRSSTYLHDTGYQALICVVLYANAGIFSLAFCFLLSCRELSLSLSLRIPSFALFVSNLSFVCLGKEKLTFIDV
jgi:hypothetical protein